MDRDRIILLLLSIILAFYSPSLLAQFTGIEQRALAADIDSLAANRNVAVCYIQPNKGIYETGEDLWFKAYLLDGKDLTPFTSDTTLYIQVTPVNGGKEVIQEKILLLNGFAAGHLYVDDSIAEGEYYLQAFSAHSYMGADEFKDQRKIVITKSIIPVVSADYILDKQQFKTKDTIGLEVTLKARSGSGLELAGMTAFLERNGQVIETIKAPLDIWSKARLVFKPVETLSGVVISMRAIGKNKSTYPLPQIQVPHEAQRLYFNTFPEGGYLVKDLPNVVAFKATNEKGMPVEVNGVLLEDGKPIVSLATIHDGMGRLSFIPQKNKEYRIVLNAPYSDSSYLLQNIRNEGLILSFTGKTPKGYQFKIFQNASAQQQSIFLRLQVKGKVYNLAKALLETVSLLHCHQPVFRKVLQK